MMSRSAFSTFTDSFPSGSSKSFRYAGNQRQFTIATATTSGRRVPPLTAASSDTCRVEQPIKTENAMDAIITAATGYSDADLQPFLHSVDRACPDAQVFLIAYKRDFQQVEHLRWNYPFIEPVYVRRKFDRGGKVYRWIARHFIDEDYSACGSFWRRVGLYSLHIMLERYFLALELVQAHRDSFRNVLLADSRDVVLQQNPFGRIGERLVSGLEEKTIGCCSMNSAWITDLYGTDVYTRLCKRRIVCAGITLGPTSEVEQYLLEMCREIWRSLPKTALIAQYDQGIHNYLIYSGRVHFDLTNNRDGIIATLHYENPSNIQTHDQSGVVTVQGKAPAIIHQYDRHRSLAAFVRARLGNCEDFARRGAA